jgi:hypothetical protein
MSSIADDYEDFEQVAKTSEKWAKEDGLRFEHDEILHALAELIGDSHAQAAALNRGSRIGSGNHFYGCVTCSFGETMAIANKAGDYGPWANVSKRFLGLRFNFHQELHYGWARFSVRAEGLSIKAVLTGYAYETIPKKAIRAGQTEEIADTATSDETSTDPSSLGALAQGSQALERRRHPH